jgi:hypothetical protein
LSFLDLRSLGQNGRPRPCATEIKPASFRCDGRRGYFICLISWPFLQHRSLGCGRSNRSWSRPKPSPRLEKPRPLGRRGRHGRGINVGVGVLNVGILNVFVEGGFDHPLIRRSPEAEAVSVDDQLGPGAVAKKATPDASRPFRDPLGLLLWNVCFLFDGNGLYGGGHHNGFIGFDQLLCGLLPDGCLLEQFSDGLLVQLPDWNLILGEDAA